MQQTVDLFASEDKCWDAGTLSGGKYTAIEVPFPTTGLNYPEEPGWTIYPNPTHDRVQFTAPDNLRDVTVTSVLGSQLAIKPNWVSNTCQIDFSGYPAGVYYITLSRLNGTRITKTVMKY
jgi:hypothetical protein